MTIPIVGKAFATAPEFLAYLESIQFGAWRPRYVVMHHTGAPDLATWQGWQTRKVPVTDAQWMLNLRGYYESLGWSHAPHFFFTPTHYLAFSLPTVRGTHAVSFNADSWGVECVGDFDREAFGPVQARYAAGFAALYVATGLRLTPFERGVGGLHFHRDDPKTSKTCPGKLVRKDQMVAAIQSGIDRLTGGDHDDETIEARTVVVKTGIVMVPTGDVLNVRADASAKAPVLLKLKGGETVKIVGDAQNGSTKWHRIDIPGDADGWVSGAFIKVA